MLAWKDYVPDMVAVNDAELIPLESVGLRVKEDRIPERRLSISPRM